MHVPDKKILELKAKLASAGIDDSHLVYMPLVPESITGFPKEFVLTEEFGMRVARLVSSPDS